MPDCIPVVLTAQSGVSPPRIDAMPGLRQEYVDVYLGRHLVKHITNPIGTRDGVDVEATVARWLAGV